MKNIMLLITAFLTILCISIAFAADEKPVLGKHGVEQIPCEDCHGTPTPDKRAPASACTGCHGEYDEIAKLTEAQDPNPHKSHQGELRCTMCHKVHQPSVVYCNECHDYGMKIKQ